MLRGRVVTLKHRAFSRAHKIANPCPESERCYKCSSCGELRLFKMLSDGKCKEGCGPKDPPEEP